MAQERKQLVATLSAAHYFGAQLRRLRELAVLSQAELGRLLIQGGDLVRKVEDGSRIPSPEFVAACDRVLAAGGTLLRLTPLLDRERRLRRGRSEAPISTDYRSTASDRLVLDWLTSDMPHRTATVASASADKLAELRHLDHQVGAGRLYGTVTAALATQLTDLSKQAPQVAIGYLELAGYEAVDLGADGTAQNHYLSALRIAISHGEPLYGGYLIAVSLAHLALHCGDPAQALRLARAGLHGIRQVAPPTVRAAFRTVAARARARMGDEVGCTAELSRAEAELAVADPQQEPEWIRYFGAVDFADERAHCFFDLGHHYLVDKELDTAAAGLEPSRVRRRAIDTALRASSLARRGEVEQACAVAKVAMDCAAAITSFRSLQRVTSILADLYPYAGTRVVTDLADYAHVTLPPFPTLASTG